MRARGSRGRTPACLPASAAAARPGRPRGRTRACRPAGAPAAWRRPPPPRRRGARRRSPPGWLLREPPVFRIPERVPWEEDEGPHRGVVRGRGDELEERDRRHVTREPPVGFVENTGASTVVEDPVSLVEV